MIKYFVWTPTQKDDWAPSLFDDNPAELASISKDLRVVHKVPSGWDLDYCILMHGKPSKKPSEYFQ